MLWDKHIQLPYPAVVPWPYVEYNGQLDWIESVSSVESWLEDRIGPHYVRWVWNMWTLHNNSLCGVNFAREKDALLFVLRFE